MIVIILIIALCCIKKGNTKVIRTVEKGDNQLGEKMDILLAEIRSAGQNPPTSLAQNNGTGAHRIGADNGLAVELHEIEKPKEFGALISFVSDSLSASLEIHKSMMK